MHIHIHKCVYTYIYTYSVQDDFSAYLSNLIMPLL